MQMEVFDTSLQSCLQDTNHQGVKQDKLSCAKMSSLMPPEHSRPKPEEISHSIP